MRRVRAEGKPGQGGLAKGRAQAQGAAADKDLVPTERARRTDTWEEGGRTPVKAPHFLKILQQLLGVLQPRTKGL